MRTPASSFPRHHLRARDGRVSPELETAQLDQEWRERGRLSSPPATHCSRRAPHLWPLSLPQMSSRAARLLEHLLLHCPAFGVERAVLTDSYRRYGLSANSLKDLLFPDAHSSLVKRVLSALLDFCSATNLRARLRIRLFITCLFFFSCCPPSSSYLTLVSIIFFIPLLPVQCC